MGVTLVTGADGYLGGRIAGAIAETTEDRLILAVRADDAGELTHKTELLDQRLAVRSSDRFRVVAADLRTADPFGAIEPAGITRIVHAAALTHFTVERADAARVNVEGSVKVVEFARRCAQLEQFVALSTLYAVGRVRGTVPEEHGGNGAEPEFANHYEWSKWSAEHHLLDPGLPTVIARLPTVIADDNTGTVSQHNAFHNTLRLYYYGLMSLLPGDPATPLVLATADFTTAAVLALLNPVVPSGVYHVCPDAADTASLGDTIDRAFAAFAEDPAFRKRRLLAPALCDREAFEAVRVAAQAVRGGPLQEALGSITPFAEQLYLPKNFANTRLRSVWTGYRAPDPTALIDAVCGHLVASRWGRTPRSSDDPRS